LSIFFEKNFYQKFLSLPTLTGYGILSRKHFKNKSEVKSMHGNESAENYLETILVLSQRLPVVRSVDVATELDFKKSSVSVAMKKLRESGHIVVSPEGYITLTESGKKIADCIYERHTLLSSWLTRLGVDPKVAAEDACRIEHVISAESFEAIKKHIK
jgi:Mn-dependent DtxR family transcriptional regulator